MRGLGILINVFFDNQNRCFLCIEVNDVRQKILKKQEEKIH